MDSEGLIKCIENGDWDGLCAIITQPGFDLDHCTSRYRSKHARYFFEGQPTTALGHAIFLNAFWAFELFLRAGANPDKKCFAYRSGYNDGGAMRRPIEFCVCYKTTGEFLPCLLKHGASTSYVRSSYGLQFYDYCNRASGILPERNALVQAAHDRELRAYTAVWCANHAGGSWPDMAMLLQAMVMRDDLSRETLSSSKRRKK